MGAAHSRARPGSGPTKGPRFNKGSTDTGKDDLNDGYFILCLKNDEKNDRVKVINASSAVHKLLTAIIRRTSTIAKSGWDRHLVYSYKLEKSPRGRHALIQLTAELLLTLYRMGWEPMTPIDMPGGHSTTTSAGVTVSNMQTAICFRRKNNNSSQDLSTAGGNGNNSPHLSYDDIAAIQFPGTLGVERHDCLCLETCGENYLGFHDVPNALLLDLVQCVISDWQPGFKGISEAVHSVISDYCVELPVISGNVVDDRRFMLLKGSPWSLSEEGADLEDAISAENLTVCLVACLARAQYKLQISINMDTKTRVYFFIKDKENREVRLPTFTGVGLGDKNSLYVYQPTITRNQKSFFHSRNKNRGKSIRKRIQASFRRKSARDKQKKLEPQNKFQCEMAENMTAAATTTTGSSGMPLHQSASQASLTLDGATVATVAGGGGGLNGGILADDNAAAINASDAITERIRKTSQFLSVVDQELRHLSITEVSETEDEE